MANIGTLAVSLVAKTNKFEHGIKKSQAAWVGFIKGFASAAVVVSAVRSIANAISEASTRIDEMAKSGRALGVTYQEMRRLSIVSKMSGLDVASLSTGMRALSVQVLNAQRGLRTSVDLFDRLGIEVKDLQGMALPQMMEKVAAAIDKIPDPAQRMALAAQLLGRQGAAIVGAADGLNAASAAAMRVNDNLGEDQVKSIERANDAWTELTESVRIYTNVAAAASSQFKGELFSGLANVLQELDKKGLMEFAMPLTGTFNALDAFMVGASRSAFEERDAQTKENEDWIKSVQDRAKAFDDLLIGIVPQDWGKESGIEYADAFEKALSDTFLKADAFEDALRDATRNAIDGQMGYIESQLDAISAEANRLRGSVKERMSAGVSERSSGFDIRGLMIGGGMGTPEQKQLNELEEQSRILQNIYRRLGNQAATVGA